MRAGKSAVHSHLYWSIPIPGVPSILSLDDRTQIAGSDQTFSSAEFAPAPAS